jgi:acyl-CoA synthetase (NDP forming)
MTATAPAGPTQAQPTGVTAMMEARSIALVGASSRPGSLGLRMVSEVARSPSRPHVYLVNPRYTEIDGIRSYPSLADLPGPVDLVLLGVPDSALEEQLGRAAARGDRAAVIFGSAFDVPGSPPGLRARLAAIARSAGMPLCGAGCMGFVNMARGLRALGYVEPAPLPAGPVALVTHSGSVFSALLRSRRAFGFSVAVSSGQELVTTAGDYARYALGLPTTQVLALVLEAIRDASLLRAVLDDARAADIPVVLLTAGGTDSGRALVSAHSGALAARDGAWEALACGYGVHRVGDLAEMADTLELFALSRGSSPAAATQNAGGTGGIPGAGGTGTGTGIATVHDSGLERAHIADLASDLGVPFAAIGERTRDRLAALLDPGLSPGNPLDMWGTGRDTEQQLAASLSALADDPAVAAVALAVDLVPEFDGDESYPNAVLAAARRTRKPLAVLANVPAAIDLVAATRLRAAGVPVLEGARSGLLALRHLLDHGAARTAADPASAALDPASAPPVSPPASARRCDRRERWVDALASGKLGGAGLLQLLGDYGIPVVRARPAASCDEALASAAGLGYPVVLKTDEPEVAHKSDAGGVVLGLGDRAALAAAYRDLAVRLGPRVLVSETAAPGTELALGIVRDPALGPLIVVGAGGVLVEFLADAGVALPPVDRQGAFRMLKRLRVSALLAGVRGRPPADLNAIADAITGLSAIAGELGDMLEALDINPLICGPSGTVAVDALAVARR